jgi:MerR family mercuric resistance operon transcriptional regulator
MTLIAMTIGRLAESAGVHVETIRYYQRLGLLPVPVRHYGGRRRYGEEELKRVRFIKRAQGLGFSLAETQALLDLAQGAHCAATKAIALEKLAVVERKLADLDAMRSALSELVEACANGGTRDACPIIECLHGKRSEALVLDAKLASHWKSAF